MAAARPAIGRHRSAAAASFAPLPRSSAAILYAQQRG